MNRHQVTSAAKSVVGKAQQEAGEVTGNKTQQAKGTAKQVEGKLWNKTDTLDQTLDKMDKKTR